jgi:sulfite exporter TauE/SafE
MCGGIIGALSLAIPVERRTTGRLLTLSIGYNLGRIGSYAVAGAGVGALAGIFTGAFGGAVPVMRIIAGAVLIAMGLYLAGWWRGLARLESIGGHVWRHLSPLGRGLLPVTHLWQSLMLGTLWGWLPCGLVYSILAWSAASADWQQAGLIMASFGLGTWPAMLLTGQLAGTAGRFLQHAGIRRGAALLVIGFGVWTVLAASWHPADGHAHLAHPSVMEESDSPHK